MSRVCLRNVSESGSGNRQPAAGSRQPQTFADAVAECLQSPVAGWPMPDSVRPSEPQLLPDELCRIRALLRTELLHASVEHFGQVEVAFLIDGERVRTVELSRKRPRRSPPVQIFPVEVVLHDSIGAAIRGPD